MDIFVEQLVTKRKDAKDWGIIAAAVFGAIVLVLASMMLFVYIGALAMVLLFGGGFGLFKLIQFRGVEFEYSVTNGSIDIDRITAKQRRKRLVSVSGAKLETLEPYSNSIKETRKYDRIVMAAPSAFEDGLWCFTYRSKKSGHTLVIFQPEQRVLKALKSGLSALLAREVNKKLTNSAEQTAEDQ